MLTISAGAAWPQAAPPPQPSAPSTLGVQPSASQAAPDRAAPQPSEPAPAAPAQQENPGLFNQMERLFEKSLSVLPTLKSPSETIDDLNARAKDAGETMSRLARPASMVTGRMGCPVAPNGAPDCKTAADKLCQAKGFKEGKSLNSDAAEKCAARVYMPGYKREPGDCRTENYVTRALCQ
ncbi:hypothetical protein [Bradyrhizobium sp.]|uniref:hypothetical protein n=1 Tax=Bradyrhizobium sp. TaxID=376 RepID=UPI0025C5F566|nr:hypothetical protein [Bradyrhizobium sp.]